eukprot:3855868-Rhodomonas_salina.1
MEVRTATAAGWSTVWRYRDPTSGGSRPRRSAWSSADSVGSIWTVSVLSIADKACTRTPESRKGRACSISGGGMLLTVADRSRASIALRIAALADGASADMALALPLAGLASTDASRIGTGSSASTRDNTSSGRFRRVAAASAGCSLPNACAASSAGMQARIAARSLAGRPSTVIPRSSSAMSMRAAADWRGSMAFTLATQSASGSAASTDPTLRGVMAPSTRWRSRSPREEMSTAFLLGCISESASAAHVCCMQRIVVARSSSSSASRLSEAS